ncbi:GntR family transcriptional regulator [Actinoplanes sp. DH11]|uniref:GntR family transcriptional regulator n=1 Tax=Actinoplanes sp. DH11 TaxID=2857011 RepID=UPI001E5278C6|nr:GntR family transcriptional regulator [Actinoplanes sp. DH11]
MTTPTLDPDGPVPLYEQLAEILRGQIRSGALPPNRPVPSETTLQQQYGIARDTVRHSLRLLREEGLVVTVRGKGTYVADRA